MRMRCRRCHTLYKPATLSKSGDLDIGNIYNSETNDREPYVHLWRCPQCHGRADYVYSEIQNYLDAVTNFAIINMEGKRYVLKESSDSRVTVQPNWRKAIGLV